MKLFFILSIGIAICIVILNYLLAPKALYSNKVSAYECGFDPYGSPRNLFDIHFYLVSILFIVFDLEITYLFPWVACLELIPNFGIISMFIFLAILTAGLFYEWNLGVLRWKNYSVGNGGSSLIEK